jgi:hypothetical protein
MTKLILLTVTLIALQACGTSVYRHGRYWKCANTRPFMDHEYYIFDTNEEANAACLRLRRNY